VHCNIAVLKIVDEKGIKDSWKEYMEKLMNEENEWDHSISTTVKEWSVDHTEELNCWNML